MDVHGGGNRLTWETLPGVVRRRIETLAGARVVAASSADGGFSPGLASSIELADGRTVFVKAIGEETGPGSADLYRRERDNLRKLGPLRWGSRLLAHDDDDDWVILLFAHVAGRPPQPSDPAQLARVISAYDRLAAEFDPAPIDAPAVADALGTRLDHWDSPSCRAGAAVDPWIAENLPLVRSLAADWRAASRGAALVHGDLRVDNMLLTGEDVVIVDWTEVWTGAPWLDWALAVPSICLFPGTPGPEELFRRAAVASTGAPRDVTAVIGAVTGYFLCGSVLPVIPALPTLRDFQRAQGLTAAQWLRERVSAGLL